MLNVLCVAFMHKALYSPPLPPNCPAAITLFLHGSLIGDGYESMLFDIWQNSARKHAFTLQWITTPSAVIKLISFWISQIWPVIAGCQGRGGMVIECCGWGSPGCWYMKWLGECSVFLLSCPLHCNYHSCSFCTTAPISPCHCNRDWLVRRPKQHRLKRHQTHIS